MSHFRFATKRLRLQKGHNLLLTPVKSPRTMTKKDVHGAGEKYVNHPIQGAGANLKASAPLKQILKKEIHLP